MSELDEYGIIRYIVDLGDRVVSILINDIAEELECSDGLFKIKTKYLPITTTLKNWADVKSEYINIRGKRYYVNGYHKGNEMHVVEDFRTMKFGGTLYISTDDPDNPYSLDWLLANKEFGGHDAGYLKRNYTEYTNFRFYFYDNYLDFTINKKSFNDFYGFQKAVSRAFSATLQESQKKHSV